MIEQFLSDQTTATGLTKFEDGRSLLCTAGTGFDLQFSRMQHEPSIIHMRTFSEEDIDDNYTIDHYSSTDFKLGAHIVEIIEPLEGDDAPNPHHDANFHDETNTRTTLMLWSSFLDITKPESNVTPPDITISHQET